MIAAIAIESDLKLVFRNAIFVTVCALVRSDKILSTATKISCCRLDLVLRKSAILLNATTEMTSLMITIVETSTVVAVHTDAEDTLGSPFILPTIPHTHSPQHLRARNRPPSLLTPLSRVQPRLRLRNILALAHLLGTLSQDQLDVARVGHVRVDAAVGAVGAAALLGGLVHLDVLDDQLRRVEPLGVGVGFGVFEQADQEFGGFDGPASLGDAKLFACEDGLLAGWLLLRNIVCDWSHDLRPQRF